MYITKKEKVYSREENLISLTLRGFSYFSPGGGMKFNRRLLEYYMLIYVSDGRIEVDVNNEKISLNQNSALLLSPYSLYKSELTGKASFYIAEFECSDPVFIQLDRGYKHVSEFYDRNDYFYKLGSIIKNDDEYRQSYGEALLLLILNEFKRSTLLKNEQQELYENFCRYVTDNISSGIDACSAGRALGYNPSYISRIVKNCCGKTLKDYIIEYKLSIAKKLLESTNYSTSKIAASLGFESANLFLKFFKYHTGKTPGEFRNSFGTY